MGCDADIEQIRHKDYLFDSSTLLESIKKGNSHLFLELPSMPTPPSNNSVDNVFWNIEDNLLVGKTFFKDALGESQDGWNLSRIDTNLPCEFNNNRESWINFSYFKDNMDPSDRLVHVVYITPNENNIDDEESEYFIAAENWKPIDVNNLKIPLEGALLIAERAGGTDFRTKYKNDCFIRIQFWADDSEFGNSWRFIYEPLSDKKSDQFEIYVNSNNGQIH